MFTHIVLFWLKDKNPINVQQFRNGLNSLAKIETLIGFHTGIPADTPPRPVIDNSYSVMLTTIFNDKAGYDIYAPHKIHEKFIKYYAHYWEKVVVFDAE